MLKRNRQLTEAANFHDPRSYVANWNHPGTDHACEYLKGKEDVGARREEIRAFWKGKCAECGRYCPTFGHLHHIKGGLGKQRCWCRENLIFLCGPCHKDKHVSVRWTRKRSAEKDFLKLTEGM